MIPDITQDPEWARAFDAVDRAFAGAPRPGHFTNHTHCGECAETDAFFQPHTPETFAALTEPLETLPVAFLTPDAFQYLAPGILRFLARSGEHYNVGDVLFHLELHWDKLTPAQLVALRDLLYLTLERLEPEIADAAFDEDNIIRIIAQLDRVTQRNAAS